jgi:hypothetical protein
VADSVRDAFVALEEAVLSEARLAGLEAAYATVRRRRQTRLAVVAALVVLVALVPAVAFAALRSNGPAPVATTPPTPTTRVMPTAEPTESPTADPTAPLPAGITPGVLRVTADLYAARPLDDARLEVPPFENGDCPTGQIQFHDGAMSPQENVPGLFISEQATGDVTGNGAADHVAILTCRIDPSGPDQTVEQVVVYTDKFALVGQVVALGANTDAATPQILADRTIRVNVGDREPANAPSEWRSYRWTGGRSFAPVGAPIPVPGTVEKSQLSLFVTRASGGFTVTVYNGGSAPMAAATLAFRSRVELPLTYGSVLSSGRLGNYWVYAVRIAPVAPGTAVAGKFQVGESRPTDLDVNVLALNEDEIFRENVDDANRVTVSLPLYN